MKELKCLTEKSTDNCNKKYRKKETIRNRRYLLSMKLDEVTEVSKDTNGRKQ